MGALAPETQESTIAAQILDSDEVDSKRHNATLHTIKVDNIEEVDKIAKSVGLDYTLDIKGETIELISFKFWNKEKFDAFKEKLKLLTQKLKKKGINYENKKRAIESRYIESGEDKESEWKRNDILRGMEEAYGGDTGNIGRGVGLQRGGQNLRDAIQEAQIRNNELIRQQGLKEERKEYGLLKTKEESLVSKGERLSDKDLKRLSELHDMLLPSIAETITNAADDYEAARKELDKGGNKAVGKFGFVSKFPIKGAARAAVKILRWYKGKANWLGDGARTNIIVFNKGDIMVVYKKLQEMYGGGIIRNITEDTELGYPKKLLEVRTSNGKLGEFQFTNNYSFVLRFFFASIAATSAKSFSFDA